MNHSEAVRQYQAVLEARRTLRNATETLVSFDDVREDADSDVSRAEAMMFDTWVGLS
jgi:hypothetical protein